jgi:hypothetical protein
MFFKLRAFFLCLTVLCSLPLFSTAQDTPVSMRLVWLPGHVYQFETLTETTTGLTELGKSEDQKMKVKQVTEIRVSAGQGGEKLARVTFLSMTGEVMLEGQKQVFDSKDLTLASPMIRSSVGQSVGKSFVLAYDAEDHFKEVRDTTSMTASKDGVPDLESIANAEGVADLYRRSLEMGLPKMAVKAGSRWTSQETVKFPSAGTVKIDLRGKLDDIVDYDGRRHGKITFEGEMKRADELAGSRGVTIGEGSKTFGQILFDLERGTVTMGAFRAEIKLEIQGKSIPVRQQVTTRLASLVKE